MLYKKLLLIILLFVQISLSNESCRVYEKQIENYKNLEHGIDLVNKHKGIYKKNLRTISLEDWMETISNDYNRIFGYSLIDDIYIKNSILSLNGDCFNKKLLNDWEIKTIEEFCDIYFKNHFDEIKLYFNDDEMVFKKKENFWEIVTLHFLVATGFVGFFYTISTISK